MQTTNPLPMCALPAFLPTQVRDKNIVAMCKELGITVVKETSHTLYNLEM